MNEVCTPGRRPAGLSALGDNDVLVGCRPSGSMRQAALKCCPTGRVGRHGVRSSTVADGAQIVVDCVATQ